MKIGLLAPPWLPIPPPAYGGTETIVDRLARGLGKSGHDVVVFTTGDSEVPVHIGFVLEQAVTDRMGVGAIELGHVARAYEDLADCDVVHDHTLVGPLWALAHDRHNVVTTCHGVLSGPLRDIYRAYGRRMPVIAISEDQASRATDVPITRVIHHGVDPEHFPSGDGDGGYLLFLGRMAPEKGAHEAIGIAREAGLPLKLAAKMRERDEVAYFHEHVEPLLGTGAEYVGEVCNRYKLELLAGAGALLNPIRWPEPFGLVMIEALACGTPVLTYAAGAAPEIVDQGVTGFLCADRTELVKAVGRIGELDRRDCRAAVAGYFSTERMVREHISVYEELTSSLA
jgi:glycosyltransferase involved in cell wall biosynthesis